MNVVLWKYAKYMLKNSLLGVKWQNKAEKHKAYYQ